MLIALGLEPEEMETTIIPTPTAPETPIQVTVPSDHPVSNALKSIPDLRNRWVYLEEALWQMDFYPQSNLRAIRSRLADLINAPDAFKRYYSAETSSVDTSIADQFVFDVRSISSTQRNQIIEECGPKGLLNLMICLALYDGIYRVAAVLTSR